MKENMFAIDFEFSKWEADDFTKLTMVFMRLLLSYLVMRWQKEFICVDIMHKNVWKW